MIFGLFRAARMLGPPQFKGGIPARDVRPTPAGPFVVGALLAIVGAVVFENETTGLTAGFVNTLAVAGGVLVVGGILVAGARQAPKKQAAVRALDIPVTPHHEAPEDMRARAAQLSAYTPRHAATLPMEQPARPPASPRHAATATMERPAQPGARITTVARLRDDVLEDVRLRRVAAILVAACPYCGADEAEFCVPVENITWYQLDRTRGIFAHGERIAASVTAGIAKIQDVVGQFDGNIPDQIWSLIL
jgi:hypothetical protein